MHDTEHDETFLGAAIEPMTMTLFILIVFLIVPFTMLSPFRYPQPSALDEALNVRPVTLARRAGEFERRAALQGVDWKAEMVAASGPSTGSEIPSVSR